MAKSLLVRMSLVLLLALPALAAPPRPALSAEAKEIVLDNGLRVFVLERASSPTFVGYLQFGVGGAMDPKGRSGIAHLLEHMLFKGTETIGITDRAREREIMDRLDGLWDELHRELDAELDPFGQPNADRKAQLQAEIDALTTEQKSLIVKNEFDEILSRAGAVGMNASTSSDSTNFFEQLPSNRLEVWFRMESDRWLHPVFREFYSERDVVHEERRLRTENSAMGRLWEAVANTLYDAHPYGTPVVGWPQDLLRLTRQDAWDYFRTYYSPSNCIVVLVGDVRAAEVERLAKQYFGPWQRQTIPRLPITSEPAPLGERRRVIEFDSQPRMMIAWPTVPEGHVDQPALDVLGTILGGLASSRLDHALVLERKLATSVSASHSPERWAGSFDVLAGYRQEVAPAEIEAAIEHEIEAIRQNGVSASELERAKTQVEVQRVRLAKSNMGQVRRIGSAVGASGRLSYVEEAEARLLAVDAAAVKDVARRYLLANRRAVVQVVSTGADAKTARAPSFDHQRGGTVSARGAKHSAGFDQVMTMIRASKPLDIVMPQVGKDVQRFELRCGAVLYLEDDRTAPSVEMAMTWLGGSNTAPLAELAAYSLAGDLLGEGGAGDLDPVAFEEKKEALGMSFSTAIGSTSSTARFWSLARNFDQAFAVALDVLKAPRFDADRLNVLRERYVDAMRRQWDSTGSGATAIEAWVIERDHPRLGFVASKAAIEGLTPEAIRRVARRHIGRDNLYVAAVGDFAVPAMKKKLELALCSLPKAETEERDFLAREPVLRPGVYLIEKEVSAPTVRFLHQIGVDRRISAADHAALEILNDVVGGSGFRSRLMERLRSDEGLTYGVYSSLAHEGRPGVPGFFRFGYTTKRDTVARSIESALEEVARAAHGGFAAAEVEEQIEAWRNAFVFKFTNSFSVVSSMVGHYLDDRPYDYDRRVLEAVQKVTPADLDRVAAKYLAPDQLTISIFGRLTDADRSRLEQRFGKITVLDKETVFRGGYFEETPAAPPAAP